RFRASPPTVSSSQPWLRLVEDNVAPFTTVTALLPPTLRVLAFSGDINIVGNLTLSPSPIGTLDLISGGAVNGLQVGSIQTDPLTGARTNIWSPTTINLSDANPALLPGVAAPISLTAPLAANGGLWRFTSTTVLLAVDSLFAESGSTQGAQGVLQTK